MVLSLALSGLSLGAIYSVLALGFVVIYKSTEVMNFGHGGFVMLGAYLSLTLSQALELPFIVTLVVVVLGMAVLGAIVYFGIIRWMIGRPFFSVVLVTVGLEIVIRACVLVLYGPNTYAPATSLPVGSVNISGSSFTFADIAVLVAAVVSVAVFMVVFRLTRLGLHMRAVAEDLEASVSSGIPAVRVQAAAWAIGIALAGFGGVLLAHSEPSISPSIALIGLRALPAALIGGLNSVGGAIAGGMAIGLIETFGAGFFGGDTRDIIAFGIMLIVLFIRPAGLFGTERKVRL